MKLKMLQLHSLKIGSKRFFLIIYLSSSNNTILSRILRFYYFIPCDICNHTCTCPYTCEKSHVPVSLPTMQLHLPHSSFLYIAFSWPSVKLHISHLEATISQTCVISVIELFTRMPAKRGQSHPQLWSAN